MFTYVYRVITRLTYFVCVISKLKVAVLEIKCIILLIRI